jgi:hypothetical protein
MLDPSLQTQIMYKWAMPKICGEDLEGSVQLPASSMKTRCPPCNPGFFKTNNSTCEPCPYGWYSNGSGNGTLSILTVAVWVGHTDTQSSQLKAPGPSKAGSKEQNTSIPLRTRLRREVKAGLVCGSESGLTIVPVNVVQDQRDPVLITEAACVWQRC